MEHPHLNSTERIQVRVVSRSNRLLRHFFWLILWILSGNHAAFAQSRYLTFGTGATPMSLSGDYRALGWNPAQLTFSPLNAEGWKSAVGGLEFGARMSSSVLEREDIWNDVLNRSEQTTTDWTQQDWDDYVSLLSNESIALNADVVNVASAKKWRSWGVAYSSSQHFQAEAFLDEAPMNLLIQGAGSNWTEFFDVLLTIDGDTVENSGGFTPEQLLSFIGGIELDGDAVIAHILQDTELGFSWQRCHNVGISKEWSMGGMTLHTGLSGKLMLGNGYFSVRTIDGELDAFGAFSNGFGIEKLAQITSGNPSATDIARLWGPVGQGWGVDLGTVLELPGGLWLSAAVSDLGWMEWRGERYSLNANLGTWTTPVQDPNSITDIVIGALTPDTWFNDAEIETRVIPNGTKFQIGGGIRMSDKIFIAAEAAFDNPELLGNAGTRAGVSLVFQPVRFIRFDSGISKWGSETYRIPAGLMIKTGNRGFECGLQATDIQAIWRPSQPEIGFRALAMRWMW